MSSLSTLIIKYRSFTKVVVTLNRNMATTFLFVATSFQNERYITQIIYTGYVFFMKLFQIFIKKALYQKKSQYAKHFFS